MGRKKRLTDSELNEYSQGKHTNEVYALAQIAKEHRDKLPCTPDDLGQYSGKPVPEVFKGKMILVVQMNNGIIKIIGNPRFDERGLIEYINLYDTRSGIFTMDYEATTNPDALRDYVNSFSFVEFVGAVGQSAEKVGNVTVEVAGNVIKGWNKTKPIRKGLAALWKAFDSSNDNVMGGKDR